MMKIRYFLHTNPREANRSIIIREGTTMGFFDSLTSSIQNLQKFHGEDEGPNQETLEQYGAPVRSLYTAVDLRDIHQKIEVRDEQGSVRYWTKSSMIVIKGKTDIFDADGKQVAHLEKQPVSLHEKHFITMADGRQFTLSNELFHVFKDVTNIEGLGWQLQGNVLGLNFMLFDQNGEPVAAIGQKAVSLHNRYSIDLYQTQDEAVVVAIVIQLQKMLAARRENRNSGD